MSAFIEAKTLPTPSMPHIDLNLSVLNVSRLILTPSNPASFTCLALFLSNRPFVVMLIDLIPFIFDNALIRPSILGRIVGSPPVSSYPFDTKT